MHSRKAFSLVLEDGSVFTGNSFGYEQVCSGEIVFNTAMVGYPESLTDPSYKGQILVFTFPLIGNYGVPEDKIEKHLSAYFESEKIHAKGIIISDYSESYSHWNAKQSLSEWLIEHKIPAIEGVDTRKLTKLLREKGLMKAKMVFEGQDTPFYDPSVDNLASEVSCKEVITYGNGDKKVVLVDCGVKHNIIRCLLKRNLQVVRVPWNYDFTNMEYDGLFLSNGPGSPEHCSQTVEHIRKAIQGDKPIFGICMGNQLLAMASGAKIYKLKYGHRSHNQPVRLEKSNKCLISAQNHSYAVDTKTLGTDWEVLFTNMNDGSNEGIRHKSKPFFSAQFHPEAASGATDADFLFDKFADAVRGNKELF